MVTKIEWTRNVDGTAGSTWNPIRGCSRISPGCGGGGSYSGTNGEQGGCYAEGIAARFSGPGQPFDGFAEMTPHGPRWTRKVALIHELLDIPLRRRKPTTWFISMSDIFHEALTNEEIAAVFGVMAACQRHTFQILTKRAHRIPAWFRWHAEQTAIDVEPWIPILREAVSLLPPKLAEQLHEDGIARVPERDEPWPLPNVWLGVTVEARAYRSRIDQLRNGTAAVKFISFEPLLEDLGELDLSGIDQCIVGAESGHGARPMNDDWVRRIRDQATAHGVAFFYKQRIERGRKVSLPLLDGQRWAEMPARAS